MPNAFRFFFPLLIALLAVYLCSSRISFNKPSASPEIKAACSQPSFDFIINYHDDCRLEEQFLRDDSSRRAIFLLGSSELVNNSDAAPYRFITNNFKSKVKAIGHAGNQCFSLFCQLLANSERLHNSRIVLIISPGWFESKNALGTSSEVFLEYNSERFLQKILRRKPDDLFKAYSALRIAELYPEFNAPNLPIKLLNFTGRASRSPIHAAIYKPLIAIDNFLLTVKNSLCANPEPETHYTGVSEKPAGTKPIHWDSLLLQARTKAGAAATNNTMGINDAYFTEHIHGKSGTIDPVPLSCNQEFSDFKMLVRLLQEYHANASFLISPLNALYYRNLIALNPVLDSVRAEIKQAGFSKLDLFETSSSLYEKATLTDIMHMGDYGWYLCDRFIIDTYKLENER